MLFNYTQTHKYTFFYNVNEHNRNSISKFEYRESGKNENVNVKVQICIYRTHTFKNSIYFHIYFVCMYRLIFLIIYTLHPYIY